ncbi:MAG: GNAT family N-acetyltransferase [Pseudomonadota bacterium]
MPDSKTRLLIREAEPGDRDTIVAFNAAIARETEDRELDQDILTAGVDSLLRDKTRGQYLLACEGEHVAGQIMWTYEWSDWRNGQFWWIQSVYVASGWRRSGVFRSLFEAVKDRALASGNSCGLRLYVERDNERAQSTYRALGAEMTNYRLMEWIF